MKIKPILIFFLLLSVICLFIYLIIPKLLERKHISNEYRFYLEKYQTKNILIPFFEEVIHFGYGKVLLKKSIPGKKGNKIVINLNGKCGDCINNLEEWMLLIKECNFPIENVIILVYADNYAAFEYMVKESKLDGFYAVYDRDSVFLKTNSIDINNYDAILRSFVINEKKEIIAISSPFIHNYIKREYCRILKNKIEK